MTTTPTPGRTPAPGGASARGASASARTNPPAAAPTARTKAPPGGGPSALGTAGLFTVLLGASLPLIDFFIVNVALPAIDRDLGAGPVLLELVVAGYALPYAVLLVLGGRLGDLFGRRRLFLVGMAAFGLTSLACGLAPDAWTLVGARVAQGAAAALMLPQVLATIHASTEGPRRARALSLYGATAGLSMAGGQILGGVLVAADVAGTGWRAVFLVNVPIAAVGLLLAARSVPETRSDRPAPVDVPGTLLLALALVTLLAPLTEGRAAGWPVWTWVSLGVFPFVAAAFWRAERRADRRGEVPLVPPGLLALVSLRRGLVLLLPLCMGFGGFMFVIAVALQQGLGLGAVASGLALVPMALAFFAASLAGPRLVGRWGMRVVTAGALAQGLGIGLLALTVRHSWPDLSVGLLLPGMAVAGLGQGLQLPVIFRVILSEVPAERAGVGSGVMVTTQQSSLVLGVVTLGSLYLGLSESAPAGSATPLVATLLVQLVMIAVTAVLSVRLPRPAA
ncbi:MFS transporter [Streptomyces sp. NPDC048330]|uniref:MFS transporter n=1 Tax=Streptomyces sp. NPDC048330 TaxID=3365533 RepID=UPI00371D7931